MLNAISHWIIQINARCYAQRTPSLIRRSAISNSVENWSEAQRNEKRKKILPAEARDEGTGKLVNVFLFWKNVYINWLDQSNKVSFSFIRSFSFLSFFVCVRAYCCCCHFDIFGSKRKWHDENDGVNALVPENWTVFCRRNHRFASLKYRTTYILYFYWLPSHNFVRTFVILAAPSLLLYPHHHIYNFSYLHFIWLERFFA